MLRLGCDKESSGYGPCAQRVLLIHDVTTLIHLANARAAAHQPMPGVFAVSRAVPMRRAIEDIVLLAECSLEGEWEGQVRFLPLRWAVTPSTGAVPGGPWRHPPSWPWSGGGPAAAHCGNKRRAGATRSSSWPPGRCTVRLDAICHLADARRRTYVLRWLARAWSARCRGCVEPQP